MGDDNEPTYGCEACGAWLSRDEYVALGPTTPAAKHLDIADPQRRHLVVCNECFEEAAQEIDAEGD